jgi:hypothetical protein
MQTWLDCVERNPAVPPLVPAGNSRSLPAVRHGGWMLPINIATWAASILASTAGLALGYGRRTPRTAEPAGTGLGEATSPVKQE